MEPKPLTSSELWTLNQQWNDTDAPYPSDLCLHQLFEQAAERQPDHPALRNGERCLSYGELNARSNQLAHFLRAQGAGPDVRVGLCVTRSVEMVVGLLAILKAGSAYVPLDPDYPQERLSFLITDSQSPILLTQEHLLPRLPETHAAVFCFERLPTLLDACSTENPVTGVTPEHLVYVIYTSGSTGAPKGVMLEHRGRVNNFHDFNHRFQVGPEDRVLALASVSFDMCAYDVFGILAAGATIVLPVAAETLNPVAWARLIQEHAVTIWHTVPELLEMLVAEAKDTPSRWPSSLRLLLLAGDWIPVSLPDRFRALVPDAQLIGLGGATEASMDSTLYVIQEVSPAWKSIPYGAPMANQRAYVLDEQGELLPPGEPGELHLGGVGVARGYLGRPGLTAEKFLLDPYSERPGARMYKTGDLCRWLPDGNLEILGRMDHQVKIRGVRVELGEIEATLRQDPAVREAVVLAQDFGRGKELAGYVLKEKDFSPSPDELTAYYEAQIAEWSQVYDHAYSAPGPPVDPTFNLASWDSSYTQQPFPVEEMREWTEATVARLLKRRPQRVLEIGCGLGLLLFRVAPHCTRYVGTDISPVALRQVEDALRHSPLPQVTLLQAAADQWEALGEERFDLIVLNSVVLDFPSIDYLEAVLQEAAKRLAPGGAIFVGDVRPLHLADAFQGSVQWVHATETSDVTEFRRRVRMAQAREEELLLDPAWLEELVARTEGLHGVEIQLKRGVSSNELTRFRYDAVLSTTGPRPSRVTWTPWEAVGSLAALEARLSLAGPPIVALAGLPNSRTCALMGWWQRLQEASPDAPVPSLLEPQEKDSVDPEALYLLAERLGWSAEIRWNPQNPANCDVLLARGGETRAVDWPRARSHQRLHNAPLEARWWRTLPLRLRERVAERLPPVMHPQTLTLLDRFPLTPNGKVNRKAMPIPDSLRLGGRDLEAPVGALEECLVEIWCELLALDDVGRREDFFALGGHSLLAVQWASRIREWLGWAPSLRILFDHPVLADLAEAMRRKAAASGVDLELQAEAFLEVMSLSEDEVRAQLQEGS